ncbi:hypothetical protein HNY73_005872 [Argiope bruennichi]|uniref:Uncharacterized protein n=1 Tax=Argiope bruennichi TaxID=94029 RepID=A0A8T0FND9_ARGBR|nr:hypothetical protein HNY73_005872 [Argiope bruennichi]
MKKLPRSLQDKKTRERNDRYRFIILSPVYLHKWILPSTSKNRSIPLGIIVRVLSFVVRRHLLEEIPKAVLRSYRELLHYWLTPGLGSISDSCS